MRIFQIAAIESTHVLSNNKTNTQSYFACFAKVRNYLKKRARKLLDGDLRYQTAVMIDNVKRKYALKTFTATFTMFSIACTTCQIMWRWF